jgi:hypothetical protein
MAKHLGNYEGYCVVGEVLENEHDRIADEGQKLWDRLPPVYRLTLEELGY